VGYQKSITQSDERMEAPYCEGKGMERALEKVPLDQAREGKKGTDA
jgi:hypothetical protein